MDDSRDPAVDSIHPQLAKRQMDSMMATICKHWLLIVRHDDNVERWRQSRAPFVERRLACAFDFTCEALSFPCQRELQEKVSVNQY